MSIGPNGYSLLFFLEIKRGLHTFGYPVDSTLASTSGQFLFQDRSRLHIIMYKAVQYYLQLQAPRSLLEVCVYGIEVKRYVIT
jgi:hypothetical protein